MALLSIAGGVLGIVGVATHSGKPKACSITGLVLSCVVLFMAAVAALD